VAGVRASGGSRRPADDGGAATSLLHDDDLEIVGVDCHAGAPARFLCQVGFVKQNDDPDRVFLDAALIERRAGGGWKLLRGLCKRLL
jgi:hypothetical protein